ncbi:hypothetical protein [Limnoglobus roseus]|uniref:Uncharacterized protein n=1 Tax=Limnoglobus roseus TaxID=2598579 RepID=A0A5C1AC29_9BACT|nr:hypothetical protein [Limnoglobus roseus]QEL16831.1 hypothetical protein PX52LOC_03804 [Limnoglobus roseus]
MDPVPPTIHDLARRLVAYEAGNAEPPVVGGLAAVRACERLRPPLTRLVGAAGFHSLLSRAVALARAEVPSLGPVRVRTDGSVEGLDDPGAGHRGAEADGPAGVAVVAHVIGLLATFIGYPLTLTLVRDACPGLPGTGGDEGNREGL